MKKKMFLNCIAIIVMAVSAGNFVKAAVPSLVVKGHLSSIQHLGSTTIVNCLSASTVCVSIFIDAEIPGPPITPPGRGGERNRAVLHTTPTTIIEFDAFSNHNIGNGEKEINFSGVNIIN